MFSYHNIKAYQHYLNQEENGCQKAVEYYLNNIEANKNLNAFVEVYTEEAINKAKALDQKRKNGDTIGKLHGVVIAIKDVICYKDHTVTAASKILQNFTAQYNASCVQYLLDEEAIIIGSCNCDEFAMGSSNENSYYGNVLNAANPSKVPGGSSGGSAVAVQANMCMVSLGSDTGGSVRQPADFCGLVGLKPSYGVISRYGLIAYASSFDQIGIFGNNIYDVSLTLSVISKTDDFDSTMNANNDFIHIHEQLNLDGKKLKIALLNDVMKHPSLDKEIQSAIVNQCNELKNNGHEIIEADFSLLEYLVPTYYVLTAAEASSNLSRYDGIRYGHQSKKAIQDIQDFYIQNRTEGFGKEVKKESCWGILS